MKNRLCGSVCCCLHMCLSGARVSTDACVCVCVLVGGGVAVLACRHSCVRDRQAAAVEDDCSRTLCEHRSTTSESELKKKRGIKRGH